METWETYVTADWAFSKGKVKPLSTVGPEKNSSAGMKKLNKKIK